MHIIERGGRSYVIEAGLMTEEAPPSRLPFLQMFFDDESEALLGQLNDTKATPHLLKKLSSDLVTPADSLPGKDNFQGPLEEDSADLLWPSPGSHVFVRLKDEEFLRVGHKSFPFGSASGHAMLAQGQLTLVLAAGEVEVGERGLLLRWSNKSGTYLQAAETVGQAGLPLNKLHICTGEGHKVVVNQPSYDAYQSAKTLLLAYLDTRAQLLSTSTQEEYTALEATLKEHVDRMKQEDTIRTFRQCRADLRALGRKHGFSSALSLRPDTPDSQARHSRPVTPRSRSSGSRPVTPDRPPRSARSRPGSPRSTPNKVPAAVDEGVELSNPRQLSHLHLWSWQVGYLTEV